MGAGLHGHRLRRLCWCVCAALFGGPAQAWLGPSAQDPYLLITANAPAVGWRWEDARTDLQVDNLATRDGYRLGDKNREKPSPVSAPMQAVVASLVNQLQLFALDAPGALTPLPTDAEPALPTDADLLEKPPETRPWRSTRHPLLPPCPPPPSPCPP